MKDNGDGGKKYKETSNNNNSTSNQDGSGSSHRSARSSISALALTPNTDQVEAGTSSSNDTGKRTGESSGKAAASGSGSGGRRMVARSRSEYALDTTTGNASCKDAPSDHSSSSDKGASNSDAPRDKGKAPMRDLPTNSNSSNNPSSADAPPRIPDKAPARNSKVLVSTDAATGKFDINFDDPDVILPDPLPIRKKGGLPTAGGVVIGGGPRAKRLASCDSDRPTLQLGPDGANDAKAPNHAGSRTPPKERGKKSVNLLDTLQELDKSVNSTTFTGISDDDIYRADPNRAISKARDAPNPDTGRFSLGGAEGIFKKSRAGFRLMKPNHKTEVEILKRRGDIREFHPGSERNCKYWTSLQVS
jgi:hypothetical protein